MNNEYRILVGNPEGRNCVSRLVYFPAFRAVGWLRNSELEMTWEEAVVALAVVLSCLCMVDWGRLHWTSVSVAGVCVRNLEMYGIVRCELEDRPDIRRRLRDSLIWVDLSQDLALRRLVPSESLSSVKNQGICFDSFATISGTVYETTRGLHTRRQ
jgi:hypothetical protein